MLPKTQDKDNLVPTLINIPQPLSHQSAHHHHQHQRTRTEQKSPPLVAPATEMHSQSSSLFDRNLFQNYSRQKLATLMQNNEYQKLIQFREECLVFREDKEKRHI